jgi:branched-chain amino acid transport system permease protein
VLSVSGLTKRFGGFLAVNQVSFEVREGEILGLIGPNGSGKSTTFNLIAGTLRPTAGSIRFKGGEIGGLSAHRICRNGIARTFQIPRPFAHLTVADNVALAATFGCAARDRAGALADARRWLEFTGLAAKADALPDALNLHQRKFLELARALASAPRIVLLDEVLSGLAPSEMDEAIALIASLRERGTTIVFVEHVMHAVMALTDRIVVLHQGRVLAQGPASEVMRERDVVTAYLGAAHA